MTTPGPLDLLCAAFARVLRVHHVECSPAEVIEMRRALDVLGPADLTALRAGLRCTTVKYPRERAGFELAFDAFFGPLLGVATRADPPTSAVDVSARPAPDDPATGGLPDSLEVLDRDDPLGRYTDYNPRAAQVGDLLDAPDATHRGFNPHKDDDDLTLGSHQHDLSVRAGDDLGRRGITYTVDLERAGSAVAGELVSGTPSVAAGALTLDDPAAILALLGALDPHQVYRDGPVADLESLTAHQLHRLAAALDAFVTQIAGRLARVGAPSRLSSPTDAPNAGDADVARAADVLLRHLRGAPRLRARFDLPGTLDVGRTFRRSMQTDGVPFSVAVRTPQPDRVRLLVAVDLSLSVRTVTAFALRLAQALQTRSYRCRVIGFVDTPIDLTDALHGPGDDALAAALRMPGLDLDAVSDYGRMLSELRSAPEHYLSRRTAVLVIGDARCNGRPPGTEHLHAVRRRAHRLAWITPEPRRYWHQATCALPAYTPACDYVAVARDPDEFTALAARLGHALS